MALRAWSWGRVLRLYQPADPPAAVACTLASARCIRLREYTWPELQLLLIDRASKVVMMEASFGSRWGPDWPFNADISQLEPVLQVTCNKLKAGHQLTFRGRV